MTDAHDITIRPEPIDLVALVKDIVEANQPLAGRKDQTIAVSPPRRRSVQCAIPTACARRSTIC